MVIPLKRYEVLEHGVEVGCSPFFCKETLQIGGNNSEATVVEGVQEGSRGL